MLVWACGGKGDDDGDKRDSGVVGALGEQTKALANKYKYLRSPRRRRRPRSNSRWYVKQPTWRLWGEERVDGAVYTVYLKKVRYHRPSRPSSDSDDEISHLEWETVRVRFVKAGTLERLVEALATDDGELESTYVNVFLATYRSFAECSKVLDLLVQRYEALAVEDCNPESLAHQHRKTLVACLHVWLDTYPEDFRQPPHHPILHQLLAFTQRHLPGSEIHTKVVSRLAAWCAEEGRGRPRGLEAGACWAELGLRHPHHTKKYDLLDSSKHRHFAEQLTRMDMELFKKLVPHQCLGSLWSKRDKSRPQEAATVVATVNQFNAVSFRVISTILIETMLKPAERAKYLSAWLDIARELRVLKNFSSMKAIVSGLQSNPIYRLRETWALLSKEKSELFDELERIFSEDNNMWAQRELLMREGTAKFADTFGENDRQLQKILNEREARGVSHGTIPYLGTFLTDLTMIDTAIPDTVNGLINFDKRRKEFEVLAQIKLLQGAANAYHFLADPVFDRWFDSIPVLDDREAHKLSYQIEPAKDKRYKRPSPPEGKGHRKNDSIASTSSSNSSQFYCETDGLTDPVRLSHGSSTSSLPSLDTSLSSVQSGKQNGKPQVLNGASNPDFYVIKVTTEPGCAATEGQVLYKSIMLSNKERTPQVIRNAMLKLDLEGDPESYTLAQMLPDREQILPSHANVYYAVNTDCNLNFILRLKKDNDNGEAQATGKHKKR